MTGDLGMTLGTTKDATVVLYSCQTTISSAAILYRDRNANHKRHTLACL